MANSYSTSELRSTKEKFLIYHQFKACNNIYGAPLSPVRFNLSLNPFALRHRCRGFIRVCISLYMALALLMRIRLKFWLLSFPDGMRE